MFEIVDCGGLIKTPTYSDKFVCVDKLIQLKETGVGVGQVFKFEWKVQSLGHANIL